MTRGRRRALIAAFLAVDAVVLYLAAWPVEIEPAAWVPEQGPDMSSCTAAAAPTREAGSDALPGAEAVAIDEDGALITGVGDGRLVRITGGAATELVNTGGRPLGVKRRSDGSFVVADARRGLVAVAKDAAGAWRVEVLAEGHAGAPFRFADDVAVAADGTVYFTDASTRHPVQRYRDEILENRPTGRVLAWDPATRTTRVLLDGLAFANGVALGPDDAYLVFTETSRYTLRRLWLGGAQQGKVETLAVLPGFPDNVTWSSASGVFWVAVGSPRNAMLDAVAGSPFLRTVIARLPLWAQPQPEPITIVAAVPPTGGVARCLAYRGEGAFSPTASAIEHDGKLYLGSFASPGVGVLALR